MSIGQQKSKAFAIRIVKLYKFLTVQKKEFILSQQLLRSGTSIGANWAEAECAVSRRDFSNKVYIALKECAETAYWLEILHETDYLTDAQFTSLHKDCTELRKILSATTKTLAQS